MQPGEVVRLSERVRRIVAPNPGVFTGPGTNTYLIGSTEGAVCVLDPGPPEASHAEAILAACGGCIGRIAVTHTHPDHSPGVQLLKVHCDEIIGRLARHPESQDPKFQPGIAPEHDDVISGPDYTLRVVHTPGHASNHLCYLLEEEGMLFTGDHIMNGSTVVIPPRDGSMSEYLDSLKLLRDYPIRQLAPGHGELMDNPGEVVDGLIAHRLRREAKVHERLGRFEAPVDLEQLVVSVYDDVDARLHRIAVSSLHSHLIRLAELGRARETPEGWCCVE
ncbi:MAG: MBL fold metallo-hydrolase [Gammaproteobacteria bacterium AqS3]|nr:MBL fold metallo-hydrolase [Gammaproteobacteria bacterium AqS3]